MPFAVLFCTALLFALPHGLNASDAVPPLTSGVTLVLRFAEPPHKGLLPSVHEEVATLLAGTDIAIDSLLLSDLTPVQIFTRLVVIDFRGDCRIDARPAERFQSGPLAFTHRTDGQILPFIEIFCDRIRAMIRPVMSGEHFRDPDRVLGRALGRVVAHELYHVLGRTTRHGNAGVARTSLSGEELIDDTLSFEPEDLEMIQAATGGK